MGAMARVRQAANYMATPQAAIGYAAGLVTAAATPRGSHYLAMAMRGAMAFGSEHPLPVALGATFGIIFAAIAGQPEHHYSRPKVAAIGVTAFAVTTGVLSAIGLNY